MLRRLTIVVVGLMVMGFNLPVAALAPPAPPTDFNPLGQACQGNAANSPVCQDAKATQKKPSDPIAGPNGIINKAATLIALFAGIGAVIMIILGAFFYVTSGGNADTAAKAKSRMLSGLIGLVVIALAWTIVRFVTDKVIR